MKVAYREIYGTPEVIKITDKPIPKIRENEVLIKIYAVSVNRTDLGYLKGEPKIVRLFSGLFEPKSKILGCEFAGKITEIGTKVTKFKVGDEVFGFDDQNFGAYAEYKSINENANICIRPQNFSFIQSAALSEAIHYAFSSIKAAKINEHSKVIVNGGTGAIGSAIIQFCKYYGASLSIVCESKYFHLMEKYKPEELINYKSQDFTQLELKDETQKYDVVFDAVGKSEFRFSKNILKQNGIYISTELGDKNQNPFLALAHKFKSGKKIIFPIPEQTPSQLHFFKTLAENNDFEPLIDRIIKFDDIVENLVYADSGQKIGNIIIDMRL